MSGQMLGGIQAMRMLGAPTMRPSGTRRRIPPLYASCSLAWASGSSLAALLRPCSPTGGVCPRAFALCGGRHRVPRCPHGAVAVSYRRAKCACSLGTALPCLHPARSTRFLSPVGIWFVQREIRIADPGRHLRLGRRYGGCGSEDQHTAPIRTTSRSIKSQREDVDRVARLASAFSSTDGNLVEREMPAFRGARPRAGMFGAREAVQRGGCLGAGIHRMAVLMPPIRSRGCSPGRYSGCSWR